MFINTKTILFDKDVIQKIFYSTGRETIMKKIFRFFLVFFCLILFLQDFSFSQRTGYSKDEFIQRRKALMDQVKNGMVILFGEARFVGSSGMNPGAHFRQDNDFYYFTGVEDLNSILVMIPKTKRSYLFLPRLTARQIRSDGINLLDDEKAKDKTGLTDIFELSSFDQFLSSNLLRNDSTIFMRMIPRGRILRSAAARSAVHYSDQISLDYYRIKKLKEHYPFVDIKDITPFIDSLRVIKTPEEIVVVRRIGSISAKAVKEAMVATRPGAYEYEIEAAAMAVILKNGAIGAGYPPIVGSGINTCTLHYSKNSKKAVDGDLVLMDFGGDLDYMMVDITRTWPANGRFSPEQKEAYRIVLEVQKACIEAYRPGVTVEDVQNHVAQVMKEKGIEVPENLAHCGPPGKPGTIGHYVGMTVHDVGPRGVPLKEGMVFAIEPALYYPEKGFGIRIEDTVLITKDGCEVLTKAVPKEIEEIEKLMDNRK
jgi:Xaa-Pro aminopeptidase